MRLSKKRLVSEIKRVVEKCVIGLEKRKKGLEEYYGFKDGEINIKEITDNKILERYRYYCYYCGKLYAYLWILDALGSKVSKEITDRLIKDIKYIDNKCYFISNDSDKVQRD